VTSNATGDGFKLSMTAEFVPSRRFVGGLYHNPPEERVVLCVDDEETDAGASSGPSRCCR